MHKNLKPFSYHGITFDNPDAGPDDETTAECFVCHHHNHRFHVQVKTGKYNCFHCSASGNITTFLRTVYERAHATTNADHWKALAEVRDGIPWQRFRDYGFAFDTTTLRFDRWLIPVRNLRGDIINLRVYLPGNPVTVTSGMEQSLLSIDSLRRSGPVYLVEGDWDLLALDRLFRLINKRRASIVGVPGINTFKGEWSQVFTGRDVHILFDHQPQAYDAAERVCSILAGHAKTTSVLRWDALDLEEIPDGYDLRDYVHTFLDVDPYDPSEVWSDLAAAILPFDNPDAPGPSAQEQFGSIHIPALPALELEPRESFDQIIADFQSVYHVPDEFADILATIFAVNVSTPLPGDPLWLFLVGPPGAGKTMFIKAFMYCENSIYRSSITPRELLSGYITESGDPSLLPKLVGKTLWLKDFTETLTMNKEDQESLYGILRGAYDGFAEKSFGNGVHRIVNPCHFSMVAGVTHAINGANRAELGERFIKIELLRTLLDYDATDHILAAVNGMDGQNETDHFIRSVTASFINHVYDTGTIPSITREELLQVIALAQIVGHLRANVARYRDEILYTPVPEVATRLSTQLSKLARSLGTVLNLPVADPRILRLITKVAFDTAPSQPLAIFRALASSPRPLPKEILGIKTNIPPSTLTRRLEDLQVIGVVHRDRSASGRPGQPAHGYALTPFFRSLIEVSAPLLTCEDPELTTCLAPAPEPPRKKLPSEVSRAAKKPRRYRRRPPNS